MEPTDIERLKQKLAAYKPSEATVELVKSTPKLFFVGISGAGKDTILRELVKDGGYHLIVSHTTRPPRANNGVMEQDGREYHFITLGQAEQMLDVGAYIEAKLYGSNIYGTSAAEMQIAHDSEQIAVTDIEVQGVAEYMSIDPNTKVVFVLPPNYKVWQKRFYQRYGAAPSEEVVVERMQAALRELKHALTTPYFHFVVNDTLSDAVAEVKAIAAGVSAQDKVAYAKDIARTIVSSLESELSQYTSQVS